MIPSLNVDSAVLRTLAADAPVTLERLQVGDRVAARVLDALTNGQYLLALGTSRIVAQSPLPLVPGQALTLEVAGTDGPTELRVVPPGGGDTHALDADTSAQRLAVAALVTAVKHGATVPQPGVAGHDALVKALFAALDGGRSQLSAGDLDALAHLLPVAVEDDVEALAAGLRAAVENGGLNFEGRLRALLEANPSLSNEQALSHLQDDARTLLGRAAAALEHSTSDSPLNAPGREPLHAATAQMLAQQARLGLDWAMDHVVNVDVPVRLPSGDTSASLSVSRDRDADGDGDGASTFTATFRITSPLLGPVETTVHWRGGSLKATIVVEDVAARAALEPQLPSLTDGLSATFPKVQTELRVDSAVASHAPPPREIPDLPGGSLVNARA